MSLTKVSSWIPCFLAHFIKWAIFCGTLFHAVQGWSQQTHTITQDSCTPVNFSESMVFAAGSDFLADLLRITNEGAALGLLGPAAWAYFAIWDRNRLMLSRSASPLPGSSYQHEHNDKSNIKRINAPLVFMTIFSGPYLTTVQSRANLGLWVERITFADQSVLYGLQERCQRQRF